MTLFNKIKITKPKYSTFDLSYENKLSCQMGDLIPTFLQEVVPGDTFSNNSEIMLRLAPMVAPIMHRINASMHFFFVPNRLVWDDWQDFITGGEDGTTEPPFPIMPAFSHLKGSLADFLGVPTLPAGAPWTTAPQPSMLPFRGYQLIYNEYYRDQNLEDPVPINKDESYNSEILALRKRAWEKDYFTSALPWAQRGGEVTTPITHVAGTEDIVRDSNGNPIPDAQLTTSPSGQLTAEDPAAKLASIDNTESLSLTINDLRKATRLQEWLEKNARGGSRYIEQILSHFGVRSSDARLQRPEYLGGGKQPVVISEVLNTTGIVEPDDPQPSDAQGGNVQGAFAGHGITVGGKNRFKKRFEEHGYIFGIMSVLPRTAYFQGMNRMLSKFDKFDYYFPEFAHLGEQEVKNQEIYHDYDGGPEVPDATWGYQSRFAEYKYRASEVHGDFREELDYWHMGRTFPSTPPLNENFVISDPTQRIFAVDDSELPPDEQVNKLYVQIYNKCHAKRPMPYYGTPSL